VADRPVTGVVAVDAFLEVTQVRGGIPQYRLYFLRVTKSVNGGERFEFSQKVGKGLTAFALESGLKYSMTP